VPVRGSGIGASLLAGGLGANSTSVGGGGRGPGRSAAPGQVYGPSVNSGMGAAHTWLWLLVLIEVLALVAMRRAFRRHHGG
jgi:hypothetical protein